MNKCDRCNVEIAHSKFCPLCGRCVDDGSNIEKAYPEINSEKISTKYVLRIIFGVLLLLNILGASVELIITKTFYYSWHMVVPSALLYLSVYFPMKKHWSLTGVLNISLFTVTGYFIFLELFTNTFGWGLYYVVPFVLLASCLLCLMAMALTKFYKVDTQLPLILATLISLGIFLFVYLTKGVYWPSAITVLTGFAIVFTLFVVKNRRARKNLQKNFHV